MVYLADIFTMRAGSYGVYEFNRADPRALRRVMKGAYGEYSSRIRSEQIADVIEKWVGERPEVTQDGYELQEGDLAFLVHPLRRKRDKTGFSTKIKDWKFAWVFLVRPM